MTSWFNFPCSKKYRLVESCWGKDFRVIYSSNYYFMCKLYKLFFYTRDSFSRPPWRPGSYPTWHIDTDTPWNSNFDRVETHENGTKEWYRLDVLHREDGPAVEYANGDKEWWWRGKRFRIDDGPVAIYGNKEYWYKYGDFEKVTIRKS